MAVVWAACQRTGLTLQPCIVERLRVASWAHECCSCRRKERKRQGRAGQDDSSFEEFAATHFT